jgi:transcriptional regulator with XRE-family HTH domain
MEHQGISIRDLSTRLTISYEHIRRIVKGESIPSLYILKAISQALGLQAEEMERLAKVGRLNKKFGSLPIELSGKDSTLQPIEQIWNDLTAEHKEDLIAMARKWAERDRASSKGEST